jgi:CubicO group peptidase (beta-lactamase class C family)
MNSLSIPGLSISVLKKGKIIFKKAYGYSNIELKSPATIQSSYHIGSVTKTFTAVATMMLWEEGKFKLDDNIGTYLPDLPPHWKPVTIRQLLNHTSGITTNLENPDAYCKFNYKIENYTQRNVIEETACLKLRFEPGSKFEYSGRNYFLIGMLIEKLTGKTYEQFLREKIFLRLHMDNTSMINYEKIILNRADGYNLDKGILTNSQQMNPIIEFADGGLVSTIEDLEKWMAGIKSGNLLKPATLNIMWNNPVLSDGSTAPYGIGFGLSPFNGWRRVGHTGGIPGYSSCITHFIDSDVTVILLSNTYHDKYNVGLLANRIAELYSN